MAISFDEFENLGLEDGDNISFNNQQGKLSVGQFRGFDYSTRTFKFQNFSNGKNEVISLNDINNLVVN